MADRDDDPAKGAEAFEKMEQRLSHVMGALKGAFAQIVDLAQKAEQASDHTASRTASSGDPNASGGPIVRSGLTVRVGGLSAPSALTGRERAADRAADRAERVKPDTPTPPPASPSPQMDTPREPMIDVFNETKAYVVTVELPGVDANDLSVSITDEGLVLETTGGRSFRAVTPIPAGVNTHAISHALRNGILEIRLPKTDA